MSGNAIAQILLFLGFTGFAFILLRHSFQFAAEGRYLFAIPAALTCFGVLAASVFVRLKLNDFLIFHLAFLAMIFFAWWRKTSVAPDKLAAMAEDAARRTGTSAAAIRQSFIQARQLLALGFAGYVIAFLAAFFYLLPRP
ncbi:MAG: hypothetical protein J0H62_02935 [Rhizobiales bacterium]|nr:hypothetical protein [Hyphomicrobiales bacterium]